MNEDKIMEITQREFEDMVEARDTFYADYRMKCDVETKTLHEQIAALTKERDAWNHEFKCAYAREVTAQNNEAAIRLLMETYQLGGCTDHERLARNLLASQAREAKLREALEDIKFCTAPEPDDGSHHENAYLIATETVALPTDNTALQQRLAEERERCAKVCEDKYGGIEACHCADAIRSMK